MAWKLGGRKRAKQEAQIRATDRDQRMMESQMRLLEAVQQATNEAVDVTKILRSELDDSIRQFEITAGILTDGLMVCAQNGVILSMNPAAERMFLRTTEHGVVRIGDLLTVNREKKGLWEALSDPTTTIMGNRADGQSFVANVSVARLDRSDGTITYLLLVRGDDGAGLNRILGRSFDGVVIVNKGMILAANDTIATTLGYAPTEITKLTLSEIISDDDLAMFRINSDNDLIDARFDATLRCKDGITYQSRVTLTHIDWAGTPVCVVTIEMGERPHQCPRDAEYVQCSGTDYSMKSTRSDRSLLPISCHLSPSFDILYANKAFCAAYGIPKGGYVGMNLRDAIPPHEFDTAKLHLSSLKPGTPERVLSVKVRGEGGENFQEWIDSVIYDDSTGEICEFRRTGKITYDR